MTGTEAKQFHESLIEFFELVRNTLPKDIEISEPYYGDDRMVQYTLYELDIVELEARYRRYLGCGDYDYFSKSIDLEELFRSNT